MNYNSNENKGIIYILTNESMPGLIKIGITTNLKQRLQSLDTTGIPTPFKIHYAIEIENYKEKEKLIHLAFAKDKVRPNREFFTIEPENATALFKALGGKEIDPSFIDISIDEDGKEISSDKYNKKLPQTPITTFKMLKINKGEELIFTRDDNIICTVYNDRKVQYNNTIYSLSALSKKLLKENHNWKDGNVNGFQFWKYNNEILTERRNKIENEFI